MTDGGGFGMVQRDVMRDKTLPPQAKALYALLCSYAGKKNYCFPTVNTLCEDLGLSKPMIIKYLALLEERGVITKSFYEKGGSNNAHKYVLGTEVQEPKTKPEPVSEPAKPATPEVFKSKADLTLDIQKLSALNLQEIQKLNGVDFQRLNTLNLSYKGRIITIEKEHIKKEVRDFFGIREQRHFHNFALIGNAIEHYLAHQQFEAFYEQFKDYEKYKKFTSERIHSVEAFFGNEDDGFCGQWSAENWEHKLKNLQNKSSPQAAYAGNIAEKEAKTKSKAKDVD